MWHTFIYHLIGVLATIVVYVYVAIRAYDEHTGVVILASLFSGGISCELCIHNTDIGTTVL